MVDDEGLLRTLKAIFNISMKPDERLRILVMREVLCHYTDRLNAVVVVARKV